MINMEKFKGSISAEPTQQEIEQALIQYEQYLRRMQNGEELSEEQQSHALDLKVKFFDYGIHELDEKYDYGFSSERVTS